MKSIEHAKDRDLGGSLQAIQRAAQRARDVGAQTGTDLLVMRDGKITRVPVSQSVGMAHRMNPQD